MSNVTTHNQLISKELLSKVMDLDIEYIDDEIPKSSNLPEQSESSVHFTVKDRDGEYYFINKYELASKAKSWIYNNTKYYILVQPVNDTQSYSYVYLEYTDEETPVITFVADTEYEAILHACNWVFAKTEATINLPPNICKKFNINASDLCTVSFNKEEMPEYLYREYADIPNVVKDRYEDRHGGGEYLYFWTIPANSIPPIKG